MIGRRRVIQILAASAAAFPMRVSASVARWRGRAMGADVSLDLYGAQAGAVTAAKQLIQAMEARFSIYDPDSELSRLNARGHGRLSLDMRRLLDLCDGVHRATDGMFDPTVQPIYTALANGQTPDWDLVGWGQIARDGDHVQLGPNQKLTLNGIAQGYVTDRVKALLWDHGLRHALIHVGEHAAIGGPFRLSLDDPLAGPVGQRTIENGAIATSSPTAQTLLGAHAHILHPLGGRARWSTVSVEADSAARADGLSTAMALLPAARIRDIARSTGVQATVIDARGDVLRLR